MARKKLKNMNIRSIFGIVRTAIECDYCERNAYVSGNEATKASRLISLRRQDGIHQR